MRFSLGLLIAAGITEAYIIPQDSVHHETTQPREPSKRAVIDLAPMIAKLGMQGLAGFGAYEGAKHLLQQAGIISSSQTSFSSVNTSFNTSPATVTVSPKAQATSAVAGAAPMAVPAGGPITSPLASPPGNSPNSPQTNIPAATAGPKGI